ncbi:thermophilic carboxylesterase Est2 [Xenorhabdus mauleonii]|uniref:Acetyl esterase n=1 Tax=Xenorhabdus mauleonii TaxID=351675 RepID=A0A1I3PJV4_9GAMM|nr:alpha/beta hydrolase fold domain-containing protein [Xenorhabdus mauleonii]PHM44779.1 thermophilic carboxylesterase Est2 [Xenorhabdus mauleonii]SFJ21650.1 acetyl esterase [Xenorhabdus mauleonii]
MTQYTDSILDYNYACSVAQDPYFYDIGVEYFRETFKAKFARFPVPPNPHLKTTLESFERDGCDIQIKIYKNDTRQKNLNGDTCIIYAHGGGFIGGGFELVDGLCQDFVFDLGVTVIAVDYRGAPEFRHPTGPLDFMAGVQHVRMHAEKYGINPNKIFLSGESSGGCIAVAVPLMLRDKGLLQVAGVISINPVLNTHRWANRQVHDCSKEYQDEMYFFTSHYLGENQDVFPEYASPLLIENVEGMPPTIFFAAKSDPLSVEADQMHKRLKEVGAVTYIHIDEIAIHGSIRARYYYRFARSAYDSLLENIKKIIG